MIPLQAPRGVHWRPVPEFYRRTHGRTLVRASAKRSCKGVIIFFWPFYRFLNGFLSSCAVACGARTSLSFFGFGPGTCVVHATVIPRSNLTARLDVKVSTIPGAGYGLFAADDSGVDAHELIAVYTFDFVRNVVEDDGLTSLYGEKRRIPNLLTAGEKREIEDYIVYDRKRQSYAVGVPGHEKRLYCGVDVPREKHDMLQMLKKHPAAASNEPPYKGPKNKANARAVGLVSGERSEYAIIGIMAGSKGIQPGEEIFWSYGKDYSRYKSNKGKDNWLKEREQAFKSGSEYKAKKWEIERMEHNLQLVLKTLIDQHDAPRTNFGMYLHDGHDLHDEHSDSLSIRNKVTRAEDLRALSVFHKLYNEVDVGFAEPGGKHPGLSREDRAMVLEALGEEDRPQRAPRPKGFYVDP